MLLILINVNAAASNSCQTSLGKPLLADSKMKASMILDSEVIQLEAGRFESTLGDSPLAFMSGGVILRHDKQLMGADSAQYNPLSKALILEGDVRYEDPGTQINSDIAEFSYGNGHIQFDGATFLVGASNGRGSADVLEISRNGRLELGDVEYTTCPFGSEDWLIQGKSIVLDTKKGISSVKGMKLKFKGLPILYSPYLSFPLGNTRKSGLLTPEIGSSGRSGNEIRLPWYLNIAPNFDATITPRLLSNRGVQVAAEFRYLTKKNKGFIAADYLPDDNLINIARHQFKLEHQTLFGNGWRNQINLNEVSDNQYYEDLGGSLSISSVTHLNRSIRLDYYSPNLSILGQIQDYQTIDDVISENQKPYRRLPQILINGNWSMPLGFRFGFDGEAVNFDRDIGVTGWRFNASPKLEVPIKRPGWFFTPAIALDHTFYQLKNTLPNEQTSLSRITPITSVDTGLFLERSMKNSKRIQTIEPRLLYTYIPHRDQDNLPIFDTIIPDFNLVQLFRKNRYLGVDRIGDTNHFSVGVTTRILNLSSGRELMSATIGQTRYLSDHTVKLGSQNILTDKTSDYIAQLRILLFKNVNFDFGHQWGSGNENTTKTEARLQYKPSNNKVLNISYRFRKNSLEQADLSWSWPLANRWNFVGRYNFSLRDKEVLEQFFGLEYESCCWGLRLVSRRHLSTRNGAYDSSFGLQLVLKGMTSVGTAADKLLERGILGYSADIR
ncbi:MAG: hypothetical protein CMQ54_01160 [Gammaproteobacteria bacterium]|nr:hypothetical protein [Gammaproteobacteria bacterium]